MLSLHFVVIYSLNYSEKKYVTLLISVIHTIYPIFEFSLKRMWNLYNIFSNVIQRFFDFAPIVSILCFSSFLPYNLVIRSGARHRYLFSRWRCLHGRHRARSRLEVRDDFEQSQQRALNHRNPLPKTKSYHKSYKSYIMIQR